MKKKILSNKFIFTVVLAFFTLTSFGQVGIGVSTPEGALDVSSSTMGIVFPVVSLTSVTTETITNPNGPNIVAGTTIYNTNTVGVGVDRIYPGIYFWNGTRWQSQRERKDNALFYQDTDVRTGSDDTTNGASGKQTIPFNNNSFTPFYSGNYAIHVTVHYGAGNLNSVSSPQFVNFAKQEGEFEFIFDGNAYTFDLSTYSVYNNDSDFDGGSLRTTTNAVNQIAYDYEETLVSGTPYTFSLTFNQADAPGFEGSGDIIVSPAGDGRGYITINNSIRCTVEINYVYQ